MPKTNAPNKSGKTTDLSMWPDGSPADAGLGIMSVPDGNTPDEANAPNGTGHPALWPAQGTRDKLVPPTPAPPGP